MSDASSGLRRATGRASGRVVAVAANTFRETVRERLLYNLVFFAVLMTLAGLLLGQLSIRQDEKIIKDVGLAAIDFFGTVIAVFIGVGLVSKEIERRSLYPLLAKPVSRSEFFLGKFAGLVFTLLVNVAVMTAGIYLTLVFTGRHVDPLLLEAVYPLFLGFVLVVAFAMLFSTVGSSSTIAAGLTLGVVVAGRFADVIRHVRDVAPGVPPWLAEGLYAVLPNFQNFDFKNGVAYGDPVPGVVLLGVTVYGAAYVAVLLALGLRSFAARDFQ